MVSEITFFDLDTKSSLPYTLRRFYRGERAAHYVSQAVFLPFSRGMRYQEMHRGFCDAQTK